MTDVNEDHDTANDDDEYGDDDVNQVGAPTAQAVVQYIVEKLVEDPDAVRVEVDERGRRLQVNVYVGPGDMGRVIGRRGRVAQAVRAVGRAAAAADDVEVDVEFID